MFKNLVWFFLVIKFIVDTRNIFNLNNNKYGITETKTRMVQVSSRGNKGRSKTDTNQPRRKRRPKI
jgi:hypothetical protein